MTDDDQHDPAKDEVAIRVGSPFAVDPVEVEPSATDAESSIAGKMVDPVIANASPETFYDIGPLRYTAMGAVAAAVMVLGFAVAAAWWFPAGGTLVAALGCLLSIFGLYSPVPLRSAALLAMHAVVFVLCYGRMISDV